jgi:hypothetical protein
MFFNNVPGLALLTFSMYCFLQLPESFYIIMAGTSMESHFSWDSPEILVGDSYHHLCAQLEILEDA